MGGGEKRITRFFKRASFQRMKILGPKYSRNCEAASWMSDLFDLGAGGNIERENILFLTN